MDWHAVAVVHDESRGCLGLTPAGRSDGGAGLRKPGRRAAAAPCGGAGTAAAAAAPSPSLLPPTGTSLALNPTLHALACTAATMQPQLPTRAHSRCRHKTALLQDPTWCQLQVLHSFCSAKVARTCTWAHVNTSTVCLGEAVSELFAKALLRIPGRGRGCAAAEHPSEADDHGPDPGGAAPFQLDPPFHGIY